MTIFEDTTSPNEDFIEEAVDVEQDDGGEGVNLTDFVAYMPQHKYIYIPTREMWPGASVNARIPPSPLLDADGQPLLDEDGNQKYISASAWLDRNSPVEQMTWAPGFPMQIPDRLVAAGGWVHRNNVTCFNLYRPPTIIRGNPGDVAIWIDHIKKVYSEDAEHILNWCAHRVQRPDEKINHALFLGGEQGIGKDTILEPVKRAVGPWNFEEVTPQAMTSQFNGYLKSVILRINEARDLGDVDRYKFYEQMKTYTAAPPDVHQVNEKNLKEHYVMNCNGVIITSNYKTDGIYLPADDRRNYVAWSDLTKEDFTEDYWRGIWDWYQNGGDRNVAAYLASRDISQFNAKAPPFKTEAFWTIVNSNLAPEESELADLLDGLDNPKAVTIKQLISNAPISEIRGWLLERKNRRAIPHKMETCGYIPHRNTGATDGYWVVNRERQTIYVRRELAVHARHEAARALVEAGRAR